MVDILLIIFVVWLLFPLFEMLSEDFGWIKVNASAELATKWSDKCKSKKIRSVLNQIKYKIKRAAKTGDKRIIFDDLFFFLNNGHEISEDIAKELKADGYEVMINKRILGIEMIVKWK